MRTEQELTAAIRKGKQYQVRRGFQLFSLRNSACLHLPRNFLTDDAIIQERFALNMAIRKLGEEKKWCAAALKGCVHSLGKLRDRRRRRKAALRLIQWMDRSLFDYEVSETYILISLVRFFVPFGTTLCGSLLSRARLLLLQRADHNSYAAFIITCTTPDALGARHAPFLSHKVSRNELTDGPHFTSSGPPDAARNLWNRILLGVDFPVR